jgi:hypothetical protein
MHDDSWFESAISPDDPELTAEGLECLVWDDPAASFRNHLYGGIWPVRMPLVLEVYAEGPLPRTRLFRPGDEPRKRNSQIVKLVLEYDRAYVREMILERYRSPHDPDDSPLDDIVLLARVDRACFLETAAEYFVRLLSANERALYGDPYLPAFLQDLYEYDPDLIPEFVAAATQANAVAGRWLRDTILAAVDHPQVCEHLGWLVAAAIAERVREL